MAAKDDERLVELITNLVQSLERKMDQGFAALSERFDTQAARLDRQVALIQTGSRWDESNE